MPTPLAATRIVPPDSRMDALDPSDAQRLIAGGKPGHKYATAIDRESAHEIVTARIQAAQEAAAKSAAPETETASQQQRAEREAQRAAKQRERMMRTGLRTGSSPPAPVGRSSGASSTSSSRAAEDVCVRRDPPGTF